MCAMIEKLRIKESSVGTGGWLLSTRCDGASLAARVPVVRADQDRSAALVAEREAHVEPVPLDEQLPVRVALVGVVPRADTGVARPRAEVVEVEPVVDAEPRTAVEILHREQL